MQKIIGLVHTRFSTMGGEENYINKLVPDLLNIKRPTKQWKLIAGITMWINYKGCF